MKKGQLVTWVPETPPTALSDLLDSGINKSGLIVQCRHSFYYLPCGNTFIYMCEDLRQFAIIDR